jgi:hypothetical protein
LEDYPDENHCVESGRTYSAFVGTKLPASGALENVLAALKSRFDQDEGTLFLIFEDQTGKKVDFDLRGKPDEVLTRYHSVPVRAGPSRPKLGVVARAVSLLPRRTGWSNSRLAHRPPTVLIDGRNFFAPKEAAYGGIPCQTTSLLTPYTQPRALARRIVACLALAMPDKLPRRHS